MTDNLNDANTTFFAPLLYLKNVADAIEFYKKAFDAIELRRWSNADGSVHVAELSINEALFHLHEEVATSAKLSAETLKATTVVIGLFVAGVYEITAKAVAAGATETSPVQDYDYGYRQSGISDPFGYHWQIEKKI